MWDVFISHAAEDKDQVARPLAEALTAAGFKVWYDELTLKLGDGLARTIDRGLAQSRYGVVVLSPAFFAKEWPRRELDGLTVRELSAGKVILPVWHKVSREEVERYSLTLADKMGVSTDQGMAYVVQEVMRVLKDESGPAAAQSRAVPLSVAPRRRHGWWRMIAAIVLAVTASTAFIVRYVQPTTPSAAAPDISGRWFIPATERTPKTYLDFQVLDGQLTGTTEALHWHQRKAMIVDAQLSTNRVVFTTRRGSMVSPNGAPGLVQHYQGRIDSNGQIHFAVQTDGGHFEDVTAQRVVASAPGADLVATLSGQRGAVDHLAVLPNGRLACGSRDKTVRVWNLATGKTEWELTHRDSVDAVIALDGEQLLTADLRILRLWDLHTGKEVRTFKPTADNLVTALRMGAGRVVTSRLDGWLDDWDIASGRIKRSVQTEEQAYIGKMAVLPDGRLATGDRDGTVRLWDATLTQSLRLGERGDRGTGHSVTGLQALHDGRIAASIDLGRTQASFVWSADFTQKQAIVLANRPVGSQVMALFDDGRLALVDANQDVTLWDPTALKGEVVANVEAEAGEVAAILQLPGRRFAMGLTDGTVKIMKLR